MRGFLIPRAREVSRKLELIEFDLNNMLEEAKKKIEMCDIDDSEARERLRDMAGQFERAINHLADANDSIEFIAGVAD